MKGLRNLLNKDYEDFLQQKLEQNNQNKLITKRTVATRESGRPIGSRINQRLSKPESASQSMGNLFTNVKGNLFTSPKHSLQQEASPYLTEQQEKFIVKQYWRSLLRWQGFDDYLFLRDPLNIKHIKGRDILTKNDVVEELNSQNMHVQVMYQADSGMQEYKDQHRRLQMQQLQKLYQPGEANYQKFNPDKYKQTFFGGRDAMKLQQLVFENSKFGEFIEKIQKLLQIMNEKMVVEEVNQISPVGERMIRLLWKIGCLNMFLVGYYIHNMILEIYGKEKLAYSNWKKVLRICNMQGNHCHKYKLIAYKHISKICIKLQQYDKSLIYLKKMLKLSWIVNDTNYEIFTYDKISLCYYYKQDMNKAIYYHEKFAQGEYEEPGKGMRNVGEAAYLLDAKTKEGFIDQNSYSEDEYDLDVLLQNGNLNKWETENKRKDLKILVKKIPMEYKKGHSFGKIHRPTNKVIDFKHAMLILHQFQNKQSIPLGPIYQREVQDQQQEQTAKKFKKKDQTQSCQYLFNQKSTNRVASNFLLQEEIKEQNASDTLCFKPSENVYYIKKMIRVFQYDLKYLLQKQSLFKNSTDCI
ncbi:unnamed protein product [Paramecium sonneborni]|uniref:Uncharacterized protein n=1 Tax=Paramecium sonneborni TaxID=65129 RepID=A0A8S1PFF0_9CILI|nr:unnamed protein product [Paramecium sonneborni]